MKVIRNSRLLFTFFFYLPRRLNRSHSQEFPGIPLRCRRNHTLSGCPVKVFVIGLLLKISTYTVHEGGGNLIILIQHYQIRGFAHGNAAGQMVYL